MFSFFLFTSRASAMIDQNGNGLSDVWEYLYGVYGINPNIDSDGDGFFNWQEAVAGTDPNNPASYPRFAGIYASSTNVLVNLSSFPGKVYQLLSVTNLGSTNWFVETNLEATAGTNLIVILPAATTAKFYTFGVADASSDGVGLSDWEAYELGLDPNNPYSNGQQDSNGNALNDWQFATNMLASQNVVTIVASGTTAMEPDPGQNVTAPGQFTITRGGFPLGNLTVYLAPGGPGAGYATGGVDYTNLPASVTLSNGVSSLSINLMPMANTNLAVPVLAQLLLILTNSYTVSVPSNAAVVIYPSATPQGYGLLGQYYTNSSTTYTNPINFNPTNLFLTRIDTNVDFNWTNGTVPNLSNGAYCVRWTGQVQPLFSEQCYFDVKSDDGCKLWVNDQLLINDWTNQSATDKTNSIYLQAGTRYDIRLDYLQVGGGAQAYLSWYSPSLAEEIIPNTSLYPTNSSGSGSGLSNAPAVITSPLSAVAFLGQPFSFNVTAANTPLGFTANGLPPGLSFNNTNGAISGIPTQAGNFQATLTASNLAGMGASTVYIQVLNTSSSVVQEIWTNVPGNDVTNIPIGTPASFTNVLGTLQGANYGTNYGELVHGYFTAPSTGNYYFWISGSDSAQLWISDDNNQVNQVLRCWVTETNNPTAPGQNGTLPGQWNLQSNQQSGWLTLTAGQQYYIQILHKAGTGTNANWSVGWIQDPTGTNNTPTGIVPGYLCSRYYPPVSQNSPGTLYTANLLALQGVTSEGVGSATLQVNAAGTQAILSYSFTNLTGNPTGQAIDSEPYLSFPSELIYDISASKPQANGTYVWNIKGTGPLAASDILNLLGEGYAGIVIQTTTYNNGEIGGNFTLVNGSQTFTPPPAPPAWTDDSANPAAAVRFLNQATFGATSNDIAAVQSLGYAGWLANQFGVPYTSALTNVLANPYSDPTDLYQSTIWFNTWWMDSCTAPDELRQRVAFALSEIFVVSENGVLENHADALSSYYDTLANDAFGNFHQILQDVTLHPAMGLYLSMQGNNAGSIITGLHADENYAREVQQLFSIGLNRLWPDGSLVLNAQNNLVSTYSQNEIMGYASVFTGWNYYQTNQASGRLPDNWNPSVNYTNPMSLVPPHHELGTKLILDNVMLPQAWGQQGVTNTAANDAYCSQDLQSALNAIYNHPNVGPFICRELIQRLVTSNPSRDYVYRVAQVFNNDGTGVRGNMQAVIQAILLDYEARSTNLISQPGYGKEREPLIRVTSLARAFPAPPTVSGTYSETTNQVITITTTTPHMLDSGDTAFMTFTDTSGNTAPTAQGYGVTALTATTLTVNAPQYATGTYGQTNGVLSIVISGSSTVAGNPVYVQFNSGGASNGVFTVVTNIDSAHFTIITTDLVTRAGNCVMPKLAAGGYIQNGTNVWITTTGPNGMQVGGDIFVNFTSGTAPDGLYQVFSISNATIFSIVVTNSAKQTDNSLSVYPLDPPNWARSGNVVIQENTWNMSYTDTGTSSSLSQSPLRSPTVFNFFYPGYRFPGALASAGLTTPEFQLTTASGTVAQMNFIEGGMLASTGNTNGLSSFTGGNGSIVLDIDPWMTTSYTTNSGIPNLVSNLNTLLAAGQLSIGAQTNIINYVANTTNFPYSTPPTPTQMRDRVRAVVHLIVNSPDYIIQK